MKRKLSALLSLVLAVVMVFPTAVFVSADDPAPTPTNPVIERKTLKIDGADATTGTITLTPQQTKQLVLDTDATVVDYDIEDNSIATVTKSGNTFTVTGKYPETTSGNPKTTQLTINLQKTGEEGTTPATATLTATIQCVPPEVEEIKFVSAKVTVPGAATATDSNLKYLKPGTIISEVSLNVKLNNGVTTLTALEDVTFSTINADTTKNAPTGETVQVRGGDRTLVVNFSTTYTYNNYKITFDKTHNIEMSVEGKSIDTITLAAVPHKYFLYSDTGVTKNDITVTANYSDGSTDTLNEYTLHGIFNAASPEEAISKAKSGATKAADFTDLLKSLSEKIYVVVEYDGVFGTMDARDDLDFTNPIPSKIQVNNLTASAVKEYIDGQTFGEFGFNGVELAITYEGNNTPVTYKHDEGDPNNGIPGINDLRGTLKFDSFVYGDDEVLFTYTENNTKISGKFSCVTLGITVEKKQVEKLEIANKTGVKTSYTAGDKLNLDGLTLKVYYNNGKTEEISYANPACTYNPKQNDELTTDINSVLFVYTYKDSEGKTQERSCQLPITVSAKQQTTTTSKVKEVYVFDSNGEKEYYIGERFDPDGFILLVSFNGDTPSKTIDLGDCSNVSVSTSTYYSSSFLKKASNLTLQVTFTLPSSAFSSLNSSERTWTVEIGGIEVIKRPILQSFTVYSTKTEYWVGDTPRVCDFSITAKYDDGPDRTFTVDYDDDDKNTYGTSYDSNKDTDYEDSIRRQISISPTKITADTKKITVTYTETVEGVNYKKTAEFEIDEVNIPDAIVNYRDPDNGGVTSTKAFEDVYNAILFAIEMRRDTESKYYSYPPEVELQRDATLSYSVNTRYSFDIDLNGHSLTMISGDLDIASSGTADTEIIISNNDRNDGKLIFSSDDEDTVIIAYRDTFTIDADSNSEGKYDVTITTPKNGKVTGPDEVTHGRDAQFTITPDEGYEIGSIKVNNRTATADKDGKLVLNNVQEKLTVTVTFKEKAWDCPFTDVYKSASYYRSIQFVYENELFQGTSATKFEPDTTMTRAMFVTVLGRLAKVNVNNYSTMSFTDVKNSAATSWYVPYVEWAASIGLVEGYGNGKFGPDDPITHAQMYVLMQRYALLIEKLATSATGTSIPANDVKDIPDWAVEAVRYAAKKDFLVLSSNRLTPNANAKRSELAVLLNDFCENVLGWDK